ncbi:hypothetical protein ACKLTP_18960, partial [Paenarthrobacter ureafaciens]|uniref:hypothetical protein n=1 Tax=Paenarthrobacter ureafaciens TaxID=37931 RepID=UPI00397E6B1A
DLVKAERNGVFSMLAPVFEEEQAEKGKPVTIKVIDAMTQDTKGQVLLTTRNGTRDVDVDCSDDLYVIGLRAFTAAVDASDPATLRCPDGC